MKMSRRLEAIRDIGVEWVRRMAPLAPAEQIRAETAEPRRDLPQELLDYARQLSQDESIYRYTDFRGLFRTRRAASAHIARLHGLEYDPESEIIVTSGSCEANFLAVLAAVDPGQGLLVLDPSYANFRTYAEANLVDPVYVRTDPDNCWRLDGDDLRAKAARPSSRALIMAVPNNPTATIPSPETVAEIVRACLEHDLWLVYDTVFDLSAFDLDLLPRLAGLKDRLLLTGGTSKVYGLPGCRVGWLAGPEPVISKIGRSVKLATTIAPNNFGQLLSAHLLEQGQGFIRSWVEKWQGGGQRLAQTAASLGLGCCPPEGGYFVFLDCRRVTSDSYSLAEYLIRRFGLFTSPGADYGPSGEGHLRLVYAGLDESCLERVGQVLGRAISQYPDRKDTPCP